MKSNHKDTILVTGGAGFIGSHLCDALLAKGYKLINLDNFNDFYDPQIKEKNIERIKDNPNYKLIKADITDQDAVKQVFDENDITIVYHLAARAGVRPSIVEPKLYERVNIQGTTNILEAIKDKKLKKFIFASSSSIYGNCQETPFKESLNVDFPISPYAATKKACELLLFTYHYLYKIPVANMRFFTVYGPRQRPEMAIHKFIRMIDHGIEIPMFGDGTTKRDYTFIEDIIAGLLKVMHTDFQYEIFNLGNSDTIELKKLINLIAEKLDKKAKIKELLQQPGDVELTYADISKAKDFFGYNPKTKISDGLDKMIEWYREN